ncbi:MAG: hypothetical protein RRZ85_10265, partial [Gordonibacter sp.]|uniref:hypothetical protein n=1 Tax=Gordonibacter sp. TaxID=1968902 RepID=UPI002FC98B6F
ARPKHRIRRDAVQIFRFHALFCFKNPSTFVYQSGDLKKTQFKTMHMKDKWAGNSARRSVRSKSCGKTKNLHSISSKTSLTYLSQIRARLDLPLAGTTCQRTIGQPATD